MAAAVIGLGHIGIFCRDIDQMEAFYRDTLGMKVTKRSPGNMVFLSTDPARSDHEIALMKGRPQEDHYNIIQQISMRVATLDDVRELHKRLPAAGCKIDYVTSHCSGIGCYYFDPEGNRCEVFWRTHRDCWVPTGSPVDFDTMTNDDILALIERQYAELGHVPVGKTLQEVGPAPVAVAG